MNKREYVPTELGREAPSKCMRGVLSPEETRSGRTVGVNSKCQLVVTVVVSECSINWAGTEQPLEEVVHDRLRRRVRIKAIKTYAIHTSVYVM